MVVVDLVVVDQEEGNPLWPHAILLLVHNDDDGHEGAGVDHQVQIVHQYGSIPQSRGTHLPELLRSYEQLLVQHCLPLFQRRGLYVPKSPPQPLLHSPQEKSTCCDLLTSSSH